MIATGLFVVSASGLAFAQNADVELGKQEYLIACAGCHGEDGGGTGPLAELLSIETPSLTKITERTGGGDFPYQNTLLLIDGRNDIRAHGGEMPIWGERFMGDVRAHDNPTLTPEYAELVTKGRLLALVEYLASIQK
ncbi:cytochrome c [Pseudoruegeria sp. M32A2M]|nr:cytochrome c [Pseudoruegeria sp. M32A2M]NDR59193.1 cytochrome c [Pseudoruegeria sp. M32A2M]